MDAPVLIDALIPVNAPVPVSAPVLSPNDTEWLNAEFVRRLRILGPAAPIVHRRLYGLAEMPYRQFLDGDGPVFVQALETLRVEYQCPTEELGRIPRTGPAIVVANHPFGGAEVLLLGAILSGVRKDFRFLATSDARFMPRVREFLIPIVRQRVGQPLEANGVAIRTAVRWLRSGGLVVVFPAGTVATRPFPAFRLQEQPWTDIASVMARWSGADIVPAFFHGANHWTFYAAALVHRDLRYVALICQGLRRQRRVVRVSLGSPIEARRMVEEFGLQDATSCVRSQTLALGAQH